MNEADFRTRFRDFDKSNHPFHAWWKSHGQYMMSGGRAVNGGRSD